MPGKMIADPRLREDDEKGCGVLGAEPLGEGVMEDLALKNVGKKSMDPVAALQDDAGQGRRSAFFSSGEIVMSLTFSLMEISGYLLYKGLLKSTKSKKSFLFF